MKNTNMKNKVNEVRVNGGSPFIKEDPNRIVSPSELLSGITGVTTEKVNVSNVTTHKPKVEYAKAYMAGKLYFDDLKNNIKDYDPSINPDFYSIIIDNHPTVDNERFFTVIIMTKNEPTQIGKFNIENAVGGWDVIINDLAKTIATIIKAFQSNEIDLTQISINKKGENNNQSHPKEKVVIKNMNQEVITKNSNGEKLQYPILVEQVKQEECPELEKAKKTISESEIIDVVLESEETNNIFNLTNDEIKMMSDGYSESVYLSKITCLIYSVFNQNNTITTLNEKLDYIKNYYMTSSYSDIQYMIDKEFEPASEYDKKYYNIIINKIYPICKNN